MHQAGVSRVLCIEHRDLMLTDLQLLSRYHLQGDATAFRDLVKAHTSMVFATAQRITRDQAMAEDVAQETFFQLARQSLHVTQSVAAWLHRVAWRLACNAVRDDATRRRIEDEAAASDAAVRGVGEHEASWAEIETELDKAIDELPDELRGPLVMHFLQNRTQRDIATQLGVSQSTVSRRVEEGLISLRQHLKVGGVLCGTGLAALLMANNATAAPAALVATLGKLSMSGVGAAATAPVAASSAFWLKTGLAAVLAAGGVLILKSSQVPETATLPVLTSIRENISMPPLSPKSPVAVPMPPQPASVVSKATSAEPAAKPMPVHELVHSFSTPPKIPTGHLVQDDDGWLWGATSSGGRYGVGTIYRMSPDGAEWEEKVSFNGREGLPRGGYPSRSVVRATDGCLWGLTNDPATLFCFDPKSGMLTTEVELENGDEPLACPTILPDGQIWFGTHSGIHRYARTGHELTMVIHRERTKPGKKALPKLGELTPDGHGWLWAVTSEDREGGSVCKINIATGEWMQLLTFTGKAGAFPGRYPYAGLTLGQDGFIWGTTRNGGETDQGTVFKIHAETGEFTCVAQFRLGKEANTGINPESMLVDDGRGFMWGTATYGGVGGTLGRGTIYKVERSTGELSVVVYFTGTDGGAPGGIPRAHLLRTDPDHFVGVTNFYGTGSCGVIYRVDIPTGRYEVLKHLADVAETIEGSEPHGSLVETTDGSLWGTTFYHGANHCGTIYRIDPVTHQIVTKIDFTGKAGSFPGSNPDAGLVSDGHGWLWGTTRSGGASDAGTIFKIHEQTGAFSSISQFGRGSQTLRGGGPMTELALDGRGQLWGTASDAIFKIDPSNNSVKHIASFGGDLREPFGSGPGRLAADGKGHMWGCALGDRLHQKASLFRIRTADDAFEVVHTYAAAQAEWSGWHPCAQMFQGSGGSIWFTGVLEQGGQRSRVSLNQLDPVTGTVKMHFSRDFSCMDTPVEDGHGRLWGAVAQHKDALYAFDVATSTFQKALEFTGHGSQARCGGQPMFGRPMRASDGNIYSVTRYGGPGNGGTIYRLRFGPTPMTQEAVVLADGRVELHGILRPNGRDTMTAFEWGKDPLLKDGQIAEAGAVRATEVSKSVQAQLTGVPRGITHYFRLRGMNADNSVPQRGAILQFTIPTDEAERAAVTTAESVGADEARLAAGAPATKHKLKVVMIPGAGAGIVRGRLRGDAYEIGKHYTLTAQADNRYVFASWSGPGISGAMAESPQLTFTFTEELARSPVITATFVLNPFHEGLLGSHHGLAWPLEGVAHTSATSGALEMQIEELGYFQGVLHWDGDELPFSGVFDTGGSARFGEELAFIALLVRTDKAPLLLRLTLDLSTEGPGGVFGQIGTYDDENAIWQSQVHAPLSIPASKLASIPVVQHLASKGSLPFEIATSDSGEKFAAQLLLQPEGVLNVAAKLPDGTDVLGVGHLSPSSRLTFFRAMKGEAPGNLGFELQVPHLLQPPAEPIASLQGWWQPPAQEIRHLILQPAPAEEPTR